MFDKLEIDENVVKLVEECEKDCHEEFKKIDDMAFKNSLKVLSSFHERRVSDSHFNSTTGYGYNDIGREVIEEVFKDVLGSEDALVRNQFVSGSHALNVCFFALLRPGDLLVSVCGKPYDTLDNIIGIEENQSSLKAFNVNYEQIDLIGDDFDYEKIVERVRQGNVKVIEIQRSRGYSLRRSLTIDKIEKVIKLIKENNKDVIIMVDNCYGEFVDEKEPIELGADIMVGSLIKNLGGGIAPNGAYVAGRKDLIELVAERLTSPGQGKEVGPTLGINKNFLQGLYMAPHVVASSLKTAIFTSKMVEYLGYKAVPSFDERRSDIVQTIEFGNPEDLIKYCQGIQAGSAIDSSSVPEPWDMPGYTDKVIMAAGAFTMGSSIELSCDAPIREPYVAFQQGGLTYEYGKLGVLKAIQNIIKE